MKKVIEWKLQRLTFFPSSSTLGTSTRSLELTFGTNTVLLLLLLLLMIWQSPGLPGWQKVNFITVTCRPHHPNIAAGLYCLATSPGFFPTLCEKWSGFFYVHRVFLSYTRDRRLKVSSERLGNEDKAPCPRALLPGRGLEPGNSDMEVRGSNRSATTAPGAMQCTFSLILLYCTYGHNGFIWSLLQMCTKSQLSITQVNFIVIEFLIRIFKCLLFIPFRCP